MGVPGFFAWLLKQYRYDKHNIEYIITKNVNNIDYLYIDANCLFHPKCFEILEKYNKIKIENNEILEQYMIDNIITYITDIIKLTQPKEQIIIAVDGIAPMAKINQQRYRRYKTGLELKIKQNIRQKYSYEELNKWTNMSITPGTLFSDKLDKQLQLFSKTNNKILYSSYKERGEGEHKIIQYIKKNNKYENTHVIYGLDADLIFLSLSIDMNNIYLLRENINDNDLEYIFIDNIKLFYNNLIMNKLNIVLDREIDLIKDFIILCFFLGNDFLPHIYYLEIKNNGLDILIYSYVRVIDKYNKGIFNKFTINQDILIEIIYEINNQIIYRIKKNNIIYDSDKLYTNDIKITYKYIADKKIKDEREQQYKREVFELENNLDYLMEQNYSINKTITNRFEYYKYYFNSEINQENMINKICVRYLQVFKWVFDYYFIRDINIFELNKSICPDWNLVYEFNASPLITDILKYYIDLDNFKYTNYNIQDKDSLIMQLTLVIPQQYSYLISKNNLSKYTKLLEQYEYLTPIKYKIDTTHKNMYRECVPRLPCLEIIK